MKKLNNPVPHHIARVVTIVVASVLVVAAMTTAGLASASGSHGTSGSKSGMTTSVRTCAW